MVFETKISNLNCLPSFISAISRQARQLSRMSQTLPAIGLFAALSVFSCSAHEFDENQMNSQSQSLTITPDAGVDASRLTELDSLNSGEQTGPVDSLAKLARRVSWGGPIVRARCSSQRVEERDQLGDVEISTLTTFEVLEVFHGHASSRTFSISTPYGETAMLRKIATNYSTFAVGLEYIFFPYLNEDGQWLYSGGDDSNARVADEAQINYLGSKIPMSVFTALIRGDVR